MKIQILNCRCQFLQFFYETLSGFTTVVANEGLKLVESGPPRDLWLYIPSIRMRWTVVNTNLFFNGKLSELFSSATKWDSNSQPCDRALPTGHQLGNAHCTFVFGLCEQMQRQM